MTHAESLSFHFCFKGHTEFKGPISKSAVPSFHSQTSLNNCCIQTHTQNKVYHLFLPLTCCSFQGHFCQVWSHIFPWFKSFCPSQCLSSELQILYSTDFSFFLTLSGLGSWSAITVGSRTSYLPLLSFSSLTPFPSLKAPIFSAMVSSSWERSSTDGTELLLAVLAGGWVWSTLHQMTSIFWAEGSSRWRKSHRKHWEQSVLGESGYWGVL